MRSQLALWFSLATAVPVLSASTSVAAPVAQIAQRTAQSPNALVQRQYPPVLLEAGAMSRAGGQYYVTLNLPPEAETALAGVVIRLRDQADPERPLQFQLNNTTAFLGTPQHPGDTIALKTVEQRDLDVQVLFAQPIPPDTTLTIGLKPGQIPNSRHTYEFGVTAFPAAEQASPVFLGNREISFGRDRDRRYPFWWSRDDIFPFYSETDHRVLFWDLPPEFDIRTRRRAN